MKRLYYSSGTVLLGDRTAEAVLDYASALAKRETSDAVEVPIVTERGHRGVARLLLGPASQLMAVSDPEASSEVDDEDVLAMLRLRIEGLLRPKGQPIDEDDFDGGTSDAPE